MIKDIEYAKIIELEWLKTLSMPKLLNKND